MGIFAGFFKSAVWSKFALRRLVKMAIWGMIKLTDVKIAAFLSISASSSHYELL